MSAIFSVDWSCCQMMFQHVLQLFKIFFSLKKIMTWLRKNIFSACLQVQHFSCTEEENSVGKIFWSGRLKFFAEKLMTSFQMLIFNFLYLSLILSKQYLKLFYAKKWLAIKKIDLHIYFYMNVFMKKSHLYKSSNHD